MIIPRLSADQSFKEITIDHVEEFARDGLRTLLVCSKVLDETEYQVSHEEVHCMLNIYITASLLALESIIS